MKLDIEPWYRATRPTLVDAVARAVADTDVADDAVDEAFARAVARWDRVADLESPTGWVYTVAVNAARRTFRRRRQEADLVGGDRGEPSAAVSFEGLAVLIEHLPSRQREAIELRHSAGLTEADIAVRMGVSRSTVSSTLRAAHRSLADRLRPHEPIESEGSEAMDLQLARVRAGHPDGCEVVYLDGDVVERVSYGSAVRDTIRIRRDDLVAVDVAASPPAIVWRWWHGTVEEIDPDRDRAACRRPAGDDGGTAEVQVRVPKELRDAVRQDVSIWFGHESPDSLVAVAAGSEHRGARKRLNEVREAYEGS
ncbi:MAG TPA: sigma-70 family RNA polymerase sigma factor [Acidimicrobiales bacterium]|nr:sigma-70 family RNA polymerase sigma factor [Acidimicrobiales bacterium]